MTEKKDDIVFLVTSGEYSDYRVNHVFASPAHAERFANVCGGVVEEYRLHHTLTIERTLHMMKCFVRVLLRPLSPSSPARVEVWGPDPSSCSVFPGVNGPEGDRPVVDVIRSGHCTSYSRSIGEVTVVGYVEDTVRQAFSETLAGLVAEGEAILATEMEAKEDG